MLHSDAYNKSWTPDIQAAYYRRDAQFFEREAACLMTLISVREKCDLEFDKDMSRLLICLALHDHFANGGDTIGLLLDVVNF